MATKEELLNKLLEELNKENIDKVSTSNTKLSESITALSSSFIDQTEEQMATFVEGTKRIIKSTDDNAKTVNRNTLAVENLTSKVNSQTETTKTSLTAVERAVRANKMDNSKLEEKLDNIQSSVSSFKLPTKASEAIPVRLSDGKKFIEKIQTAVQEGTQTGLQGYYVGGAGGGKHAFKSASGNTQTGLVKEDGTVMTDIDAWTPFRSIDIDETEEQIKATAGKIGPILAFNRTDAPLYLKFYNATASSVEVGTTTPIMTMVVPGNADSDGAGFTSVTDAGWDFDTAITVACTTGIADNDTGAPSANACIINIGYK